MAISKAFNSDEWEQGLHLGCALLTSPAMLLMDEPLASLDTARKNEVLPFINRLGREFAIPVLFASHAMDGNINLATRLVMVEDGRALADRDLEDLLSRPDLRTRFGLDRERRCLPRNNDRIALIE